MNWDVVWDQEPPLSADGSGTWDTAIVKNSDSASYTYARVDVRATTAGQPYNFAAQSITEMSASDYVEVWITNRSSATNTIDIDAMQFLVRE
ncbi:MAG: hypothetical protein JETCAE03_33500 [Ignavibacteriaceae bacterium]|nr:MAG: hypothetical protein JETCAE03_33500 [Ignavibacteriaceae bacterium]